MHQEPILSVKKCQQLSWIWHAALDGPWQRLYFREQLRTKEESEDKANLDCLTLQNEQGVFPHLCTMLRMEWTNY